MKKWATTKLYNSSRSITLVLIICSSEFIRTIESTWFELKIYLQIKKKKERKKEKTSLGPTLSGLGYLPPPVPPLPFHLGWGPTLSPMDMGQGFQLVLGYIDVGDVIFKKTYSDSLLPSHKNSIYHHKFATVNWLPENYILWRSLVPLCEKKESSYIVQTVLILWGYKPLHHIMRYYMTIIYPVMRIIVIEGRFSYSEYNEAEKLIFFFLRYTNEILLPNLDLRLYRTPELTFALEPREEACRSSVSDRLTRSRARNEAGNSQQP
jgi:hypothetical protein